MLRVGAIYGANGAGKSNLIKAIEFFKSVAIPPPAEGPAGPARVPFLFGDSATKPSGFDLQFVAGGRTFRLGFTVGDDGVADEWLSEINGENEEPIYTRNTDAQGRVLVEAGPSVDSASKLRVLASLGGQPQQSFLATIYKTLRREDWEPPLDVILQWLEFGLAVVYPDSRPVSLGYFLTHRPGLRELAGRLLRASATGAGDIVSAQQEIGETELPFFAPPDTIARAKERMREGETRIVRASDGRDLLIKRNGDFKYYLTSLQAVHGGGERTVHLPVKDESDGTQRLLNLTPVAYQLQAGATCVVDEIDRSMHPVLVREIVKMAVAAASAGGGQIVFTTHQSGLLDLTLLRRDEVWFAEKEESGATKLYSLSEFKARANRDPTKVRDIEQDYLDGRFGALPFANDLESAITEGSQQ